MARSDMHQYRIRDLLAHAHVPYTFDGALWTLRNEFICYLFVAGLGVSGILRRARAIPLLIAIGLLALYLAAVAASGPARAVYGPVRVVYAHLFDNTFDETVGQTIYFLLRSVAYLYRDRLVLSRYLALGAFVLFAYSFVHTTPHEDLHHALGAAHPAPSDLARWLGEALMPVNFSYCVLWLAFRLPIRRFARYGDLSYGTYIYAFPMQQLLALCGLNRWSLPVYVPLVLAGTLPIAFLIWWLVEKPWLSLKRHRYGSITKRRRYGRIGVHRACRGPLQAQSEEGATMAIKGQGVVARGINQTQLEEMLIDPPGPGEVLVRILASGVCHTDLHIVHGLAPEGFPFLLGHEGAGIVEAVGPGVESPREGDHVMLAWRAPCGRCRFCLIGQPHLCAASLNAQKRMRTTDGEVLNPVLGIGTFCTHTVVAAAQAIPAPADLSSEKLCLIGCGVATGVCAALNSANVRRGSTVAVFGCGAVGDNIIQGARIANARMIIGVDVEPRKLEWARQFGATHVLNAREGDPVARIKELTGGYGVDYSFEAVGLPETFLQALFSRDLAGTQVQVGVFARDAAAQLPLARFFDLGGTIHVGWYGDTLPTRDFPMLADWYRQGILKLDELVTETIGLGDVENAFARMQRGETLRSVISLPQ